MAVIDLPGTYALGAVSEDQLVARRGILEASPDVVAVILDASNLIRNLYLLLQILDLEVPVVVALNLVDEAKRHGIPTDPGSSRRSWASRSSPSWPRGATVSTNWSRLPWTSSTSRKEFFPIPFYYANDIEGRMREIAAEISRSRLEIPYGIPPAPSPCSCWSRTGSSWGCSKKKKRPPEPWPWWSGRAKRYSAATATTRPW